MLKRGCYILRYIAVGLAALFVIAGLTLATGTGQRGLIGLAARLATSPGAVVDIQGFSGSLFSTGQIARITLSDEHGRWLEVEKVEYSWRPLALLSGTLDVSDLKVAKFLIARKPNTPATRRPRRSQPFWHLPLGIRLGSTTIAEIALGRDVIGVPARLSATANLVITGLHSDIKGAVTIRRIDDHDGTLAATINYNAATGAIEADVAAAEPAGGLVATMLDSPGLPPLRATIVGRGKTNDMQISLKLESAGRVFTVGQGRFWQEDATQQFSSSLDGYLTTVLPKHLRDVLAGRTRAELSGSRLKDGAVQFDTASLRSDTLDIKAHGLVNPALSFAHGEAAVTLEAKDGRAVRLPLQQGTSALSIVKADAKLLLSNIKKDRPLSLSASLHGLEGGAHGRVDRIQLTASALQPFTTGQNWRVLKSVAVDVSATGIAATDTRVQDIAAPALAIKMRGHSDRTSFVVDEFSANARFVKLTGSGVMKGNRFDGRLDGTLPQLAVFSALADRPVGGSATLSGQGYWMLSDGSADVAIELKLTDPRAGMRQIDALLSGSNTIKATLRRDRHGDLELPSVMLMGTGLQGKGDLRLSDGQTSGQVQLTVSELQRLTSALRGSLAANAKFSGKPNALRANLGLTGDAIQLRGKPVQQFSLVMQASGSIDNFSGDLKLQSRIDGMPATGNMRVSRDPQIGTKLHDVALKYGPNQLRGWLQFGGQKGLDGDIVLDAPALKTFSALVGKSIAGTIAARLTPTGKASARGLKLTARASNVAVDSLSITRATAEAEISDALAKPHGFGRVRLSGRINGRAVSELTLAADAKDGATVAFGIDGRSGTETLSAGGIVEFGSKGTAVTLHRGQLAASSIVAKLVEPAKIEFSNRDIALSRLRLGVGSGHITVTGKSGTTLQIAAELSKLPLSLANIAAPDIGAGGELSGRINVSGTPSKLIATYKLALAGATTAASRQAGIAPISASANGGLKNDVVSLQAKASGAEGLSATATGTVRLKPAPVLNVQTGSQLPLKLLNALLAERGTRGSGFLQSNVAITGAVNNPQFDGTASIDGGAIYDPGSGLRLTNLQMSARVSKSQVTVDRLEATAQPGGRLSATGRVLFDRQAGFPVNAQLRADGLKVHDRRTLNGSLDGRLSVSGELNQGLLVAGDISLQRFDIQIPERLPRSVRELDVTHVNLSEERRAQLGIEEKADRPTATTPIRLKLDIKSDGRIFVRGRGLDAQLGGGLRLLGTTKQPMAEGEFRMIRGRLAIVGRRLVFNRGNIGFTGSLDPNLDFEANTDADGTVITTTLSGRASDPKVAFTSSPQLPEDELLARLLFNKSLSKLSPLQIAQLASEVDRIGGLSSGPGIIDQLRKSVGIDVLDVATDSKGNAAVTAGKYVNSSTYVGVQQNTGTNTSRVIVDLDITKNIKARGETGSDGNSKVGVGIEWNY